MDVNGNLNQDRMDWHKKTLAPISAEENMMKDLGFKIVVNEDMADDTVIITSLYGSPLKRDSVVIRNGWVSEVITDERPFKLCGES